MTHRAKANLPVGRVLLVQQGVDHGILEMRAAPPGDEGTRVALPAFRLEIGRGGPGQSALDVDDRAVLIEHAHFERVFEMTRIGHRGPPLRRLDPGTFVAGSRTRS